MVLGRAQEVRSGRVGRRLAPELRNLVAADVPLGQQAGRCHRDGVSRAPRCGGASGGPHRPRTPCRRVIPRHGLTAAVVTRSWQGSCIPAAATPSSAPGPAPELALTPRGPSRHAAAPACCLSPGCSRRGPCMATAGAEGCGRRLGSSQSRLPRTEAGPTAADDGAAVDHAWGRLEGGGRQSELQRPS